MSFLYNFLFLRHLQVIKHKIQFKTFKDCAHTLQYGHTSLKVDFVFSLAKRALSHKIIMAEHLREHTVNEEHHLGRFFILQQENTVMSRLSILQSPIYLSNPHVLWEPSQYTETITSLFHDAINRTLL